MATSNCKHCGGSGWFIEEMDGSGDVWWCDTSEHFSCPECNPYEHIPFYYDDYRVKRVDGEESVISNFKKRQYGKEVEISEKEYYRYIDEEEARENEESRLSQYEEQAAMEVQKDIEGFLKRRESSIDKCLSCEGDLKYTGAMGSPGIGTVYTCMKCGERHVKLYGCLMRMGDCPADEEPPWIGSINDFI